MSIQNFIALQKFRSRWERLDVGNVRRTGRFKVRATVAYDSPKQLESDITDVTILFDGYDQGQIEVEETDHLTVETFHLSFANAFQTYLLDEDSDTLVVEGWSEKMGGDYSVRIHPREADAED